MKKHGRHFLLAALCASAATSAQAGPSLDRIKQTGKITIAHRESSVPLSYLDANKKPIGYAVDLCLRLADAVKQKLAMKSLEVGYLMVTGATRIPAIEGGTADLECGSTTNNAERRQKVAFTVPHYITGARYLVRADSEIAELANFGKRKLASTKGTTPLAAITYANRDRLLGIEIVEAPDHQAALEMVEKGQVDGFAMDDVLLFGLRSSRADPAKLKVVGKFLTVEPLAIMLSKSDPELKRIVDDEMKRLITSREAYAIYEKWFMRPIPPRNVALELPMNYLLKDFWKYPTDWVPN
ncbi:MAG: amino acid ABC transporter substrate-binding protein [Rhizobiales bacterium]|nr:amino acid ABC transporter substrate-binding protein [Rhizobacter sp.]